MSAAYTLAYNSAAEHSRGVIIAKLRAQHFNTDFSYDIWLELYKVGCQKFQLLTLHFISL